MPRGGHNAKPTQLKVLQGTDRPDRVHPNEPQPQPLEDLAPPPGLDHYGKHAWNEVAPKLRRNGLLTEIDVGMLFAYCDAYSQLRRANNDLRRRKEPLTGADRRGAQADRKAARHDMRLLGVELGLSPAARGRLNISTGAAAGGGNEEADEMEEILSGRRSAS